MAETQNSVRYINATLLAVCENITEDHLMSVWGGCGRVGVKIWGGLGCDVTNRGCCCAETKQLCREVIKVYPVVSNITNQEIHVIRISARAILNQTLTTKS